MKQTSSLLILLVALLCSAQPSHAQWSRTHGPYGAAGTINSFAVDGQSILAGTPSGVYLSTDNGAYWQILNAGLPDLKIQSVSLEGSRIVAATGAGTHDYGGVFLSTDTGQDWTRSDSGLTESYILALARSGSTMFIGTSTGGIYRSTNDGANWAPMNNAAVNGLVYAFAFHGPYIYAGTGGFVVRSYDNGLNWVAVAQDDALKNYVVESIVTNGASIFAATLQAGIYRSTDEGVTWKSVNTGLTQSFVRALAVNPNGAGPVTLFAGTDAGGIFRSTNNGASWQAANAGLPPSVSTILTLGVKPNGAGGTSIFAGTWGGVYRSTDNGLSWQAVNDGLSYSDVLSLDTRSQGTGSPTIFAGANYGIFRSTNTGASWDLVVNSASTGGINALFSSVSEMYAGTDRGILHSTDDGATWMNMALANTVVYSMTAGGGNLIAGTVNGIWYSTDGGTFWQPSAGVQPAGNSVHALAVSGSSLFAGTDHGAFRSSDDGASWELSTSGLSGAILAIAASPNGAGGSNVYAGTTVGIYYSTDDAGTWQLGAGTTGVGYTRSLLVGDSYLFAGTDTGVLLSTDGGATWREENMGLTSVPVLSLNIVPDGSGGSLLVAGTGNGGVWVRSIAELLNGGPILNRWRLVSVPRKMGDNRASVLFPQATSNAFDFRGVAYEQEDTLVNGRGYWIKYDVSHAITFGGDSIATDSVDMTEGWNIVGSVSAPLPVTQITTDQPDMIVTGFFGYRDVYALADTIEPGDGYWVKANRAGKLILSSSQSPAGASRIRIVRTSEEPPPAPEGRESGHPGVPHVSSLAQNYPNPFNPATRLTFAVERDERVSLRVFDVLGRVVATLVDGVERAGLHEVEFDASRLPSGVYFYRLQAGAFADTRKMLLLK